MSDDPASSSQVKRVVRPVLLVVAAGFIGWAAWDLSRRWESSKVELHLGPALLSIIPLVIGPLFQGRAWIGLIERMSGRRVPAGPALALYLDSQLARYTPGKVGLPLVRMSGASRIGVGAAQVGSSIAIEMLSWSAVGGAIGFLALVLVGSRATGAIHALGRWGIPMLLAFSGAVAVLLIVDRRRYPSLVRRAVGAEGAGALAPPVLPALQVGYFATWLVHGYLASRAVDAPPGVAVASAGLYVLATIAGFLALAAPAGVGVREALISLGLAPTLGPAPALAAAIVSRAASLVGDVGSWLLVRVLTRASRR